MTSCAWQRGFSSIPGTAIDGGLDVILIGSSMVYLIGQYRILSIVHVGMPFDAGKLYVKPGAKATVRPAEAPRDRELWMLFARVGACVLAGQFLWLAITYLRVDFERVPPVVSRTPVEITKADPLFVPEFLSRFPTVIPFLAWPLTAQENRLRAS